MMASDGGATTAAIGASAAGRARRVRARGGSHGDRPDLEDAGIERAIAFDMGGTTAKAASSSAARRCSPRSTTCPTTSTAFPSGSRRSTSSRSARVAGASPSVDDVGVLTVGPRARGAFPGPACYGTGGDRTDGDGREPRAGSAEPGAVPGGEIVLDVDAARSAVGETCRTARRRRPRCARHRQARELQHGCGDRRVSLERGRDPREFVLFAYGGAGPVHAVGSRSRARDPARHHPDGSRDLLGARNAARGAPSGLHAHVHARPDRHVPGSRCVEAFEEMDAEAAEWATHLDADVGDTRSLRYADCRYKGRSSPILVPVENLEGDGALERLRRKFEEEYELRYGHAFLSSPSRPSMLRTVAYVGLQKPDLERLQRSLRWTAPRHRRPARSTSTDTATSRRRSSDEPCSRPSRRSRVQLVIEEYGSATVLGPR